MNFKSLSGLRKPLRIVLSVSILLAGLCLMWACLHICRSGGDQPFSRESVAAAFRPIAVPVFLCLAITVLSFPAQLLFRNSGEKQPPVRQLRMALARKQAMTDLALCSEDLRSEVLLLRSDRKLYDRIGRIILVLSTILFLTYGLNIRNFHPVNISNSIIRAMVWLLPCAVIPFAYGIFAARKNRASMEKELRLLQSVPKASRIAPPRPRSHRRRDSLLRTCLLVIGLALLIWGLLAGGTADVLTKAANICTECIGLG